MDRFFGSGRYLYEIHTHLYEICSRCGKAKKDHRISVDATCCINHMCDFDVEKKSEVVPDPARARFS